MSDEPLMDAPNQQAVGLDPPWVEGTGGSEEPTPKKASRAKKKTDDDDEGEDNGE